MKLATNLALTALVLGTAQLAAACPNLMEVGSITCAGYGPGILHKQRVSVNHWNSGGTTGCFSQTTLKVVDATNNAIVSAPPGDIGGSGLTTPPLALVPGRTYKLQVWETGSKVGEIDRVAPSCPKVLTESPVKPNIKPELVPVPLDPVLNPVDVSSPKSTK